MKKKKKASRVGFGREDDDDVDESQSITSSTQQSEDEAQIASSGSAQVDMALIVNCSDALPYHSIPRHSFSHVHSNKFFATQILNKGAFNLSSFIDSHLACACFLSTLSNIGAEVTGEKFSEKGNEPDHEEMGNQPIEDVPIADRVEYADRSRSTSNPPPPPSIPPPSYLPDPPAPDVGDLAILASVSNMVDSQSPLETNSDPPFEETPETSEKGSVQLSIFHDSPSGLDLSTIPLPGNNSPSESIRAEMDRNFKVLLNFALESTTKSRNLMASLRIARKSIDDVQSEIRESEQHLTLHEAEQQKFADAEGVTAFLSGLSFPSPDAL